MDLKEIKRLIAIVQNADISHFSIDEDGTKIEIKKESSIAQPITTMAIPPMPQTPSQAPITPTPTNELPANTDSDDTNGLTPITAQMVGSFYTAASPEATPFVKVGDTIKKGQIICIIEAMKLFNEIESEVDGVIEKICLNNGDSVEFGQTLFLIK